MEGNHHFLVPAGSASAGAGLSCPSHKPKLNSWFSHNISGVAVEQSSVISFCFLIQTLWPEFRF